ncbi:hypothetical protein ASG42_26470 [Rhizobium sp. Leaf391]|uniref:hypothetical protein n=1 Tax=Rhizobium sp. Leaf391 TaxID=1736360 RepID=UPI000715809C|nr:hypothetical protein [Rhizobium sp. Leaf391]KQT01565.1 hypothetical protein ASG42_26470 [Rhizobium sp. Leaf391]
MKTQEEIENLEKVIGQIQGAHAEISVLAKKSPNDSLNPFKLGLINKIIERANLHLGEQYRPFDDFDAFQADAVPTNSDVTMVLAQYLEEVERKRSDNVVMHQGRWVYALDGKPTDIRTGAPTKVIKK